MWRMAWPSSHSGARFAWVHHEGLTAKGPRIAPGPQSQLLCSVELTPSLRGGRDGSFRPAMSQPSVLPCAKTLEIRPVFLRALPHGSTASATPRHESPHPCLPYRRNLRWAAGRGRAGRRLRSRRQKGPGSLRGPRVSCYAASSLRPALAVGTSGGEPAKGGPGADFGPDGKRAPDRPGAPDSAAMQRRAYAQPLPSEPKSTMSSLARSTMASKPGLRSLRGS